MTIHSDDVFFGAIFVLIVTGLIFLGDMIGYKSAYSSPEAVIELCMKSNNQLDPIRDPDYINYLDKCRGASEVFFLDSKDEDTN